MKSLSFILALGCLAMLSCNKDEATLNDLEGRWQIDRISYLTESGGDLGTPALVGTEVDFASCDGDENRNLECGLTATTDAGVVVQGIYNVLTREQTTGRRLQISGSERNDSATIASLAHRVLVTSFYYELSGDELTLTPTLLDADYFLEGERVTAANIRLARR